MCNIIFEARIYTGMYNKQLFTTAGILAGTDLVIMICCIENKVYKRNAAQIKQILFLTLHVGFTTEGYSTHIHQ